MTSPLTLCLIVKNEERYLKKCVESAQEIVSRVVIVDTGSEDSTISIAKSLTDNVYQYPFDSDFSKARNYALQFVETPWVLFLDADETFDQQDARSLLNYIDLLNDNEVWGLNFTRYNFFSSGGWYTSQNLKVFRNHPDIQYTGKVCETVKSSILSKKKKIINAPILLNHFGHCRTVHERDAKAEFYIKLMRDELIKTPENSRLIGYLALNMRILGNFLEALELADQGLKITPNSSHSCFCKAQVLRSMGKNKEALSYYKKAFEYSDDSPEMLNMVGVMYLCLNELEKAEDCFQKVCELNPIYVHANVNLGLTYQLKNDFSLALEYFEKAATRLSGFLHDELQGRMECDPYREFYFETIFKYCGLGYHIAYCRERLRNAELIFKQGYQNEEFSVSK
ncbi:MAG: hypothetical protein S4CHLAM6_09610 [Chlamydiae bacterium]|nr:hypothetical protein [Chlamydiota bacterium]